MADPRAAAGRDAGARIGPVAPGERADVVTLLRRCGLASDGLEAHWDQTLVARVDGTVVGSAALEVYGADALLRSVAVAERRRGRGLGARLTEAALGRARRHGVRRVYLLTETAERFFPRFGFRTIPRADVPSAVRRSVEFTTVCRDSAAVCVTDLEA